ncbi:MAG: fasciclin domain-containing protein [Chitinophagaceae bacterium]
MRKIMNPFIKIPMFLMLLGLVFVQCNKSDTVVVADNLDVTLNASPDLTIFQAAIKQAKLETFTKGPGPFTLFAPTDAAFTAAGITLASLPSIDSLTLTALVLNHFQNIKRTSYEIPEGPNAPMTSIANFNNFGYKDKLANKIYVNGATITTKDVTCRNGIIHKIDKLLTIPNTTTLALLTANSNYSLMVQAITKASLTATFSPSASAPATIFALDNATMTAAGYDAVTIAALTGVGLTTLTNLLKYHVVASRNFSVAFKAGNLKTVQGTNVTIGLSGAGVSVKGTNNASAFLLSNTDVFASNGVIHKVAGVLLP